MLQRKSVHPSGPSHGFGFVFLMTMTAAVLLSATAVFAFPKPAPVPHRWQLDLQSGDLRLYTDPGTGRGYWYFTYTVTNNTGRDRIWAPTFTLFTDDGEILVSGRDVPDHIEDEIVDMIGNELLMDQTAVIGDILQGREHALDGLAIWPAREFNVTDLSMFVAGLSGETAVIKNPVTNERVVLRKTLQRDYIVRGNASARGSQPVEFRGETWILR